jgi:hypothetical protein
MKALYILFFETSGTIHSATLRHIPEDLDLAAAGM